MNDGGVRAIVNLPPRHGKSQLIARWGTTYALDVNPSAQVMLLAYGADLAEGWSMQVLEDIQHPEHGAKPHPRSSKRNLWHTTEGGQVLASGLGGGVTGHGADLIVVDDPFKNRQEADSEAYRRAVWDAYVSAVYTRLSPRGSVIIGHTRWHHDDLTGRVLEAAEKGTGERFELINHPALALEADELGRQPGDALWPERYDAAKLQAIRGTIGERDWAALYCGAPSVDGAGFFPPVAEWPRWRDRPPPERWKAIVLSIDTNLAGGPGSDPFVALAIGVDREGDRLWLLDRLRTTAGWTRATEQLAAFVAALPRRPSDIIVERKAIGAALADALRQAKLGDRVLEFRPDPYGSKEARATAAGKFVESGLFLVPDERAAPWVTDYLAECERFPRGKHDDQVDATSQALICAFVERSLHYGVAGVGASLDRLAGSPRFR